jgi:hypothetical protein
MVSTRVLHVVGIRKLVVWYTILESGTGYGV